MANTENTTRIPDDYKKSAEYLSAKPAARRKMTEAYRLQVEEEEARRVEEEAEREYEAFNKDRVAHNGVLAMAFARNHAKTEWLHGKLFDQVPTGNNFQQRETLSVIMHKLRVAFVPAVLSEKGELVTPASTLFSFEIRHAEYWHSNWWSGTESGSAYYDAATGTLQSYKALLNAVDTHLSEYLEIVEEEVLKAERLIARERQEKMQRNALRESLASRLAPEELKLLTPHEKV